MNKKYLNLLLLFIIIILIGVVFLNNRILIYSVTTTSLLFINKVFPFLFIMIIFNNLLISFNLPYYISKITKSSYLYIFIMSLISGCPVNAIIIKDFLDYNYINEKDASIILSFTNFNNPLFLYFFFNLLFNNKMITLKLFFIFYLCNIIIMFIFKSKLNIQDFNVKYIKINISKSIIDSINNSINSLFKIFAIIMFFNLLTDLLIGNDKVIYTSIIKGIIEITQGLNSLLTINIALKLKQIIALAIILFSGFSIHIQISSILSDYKINYKYFYISKFIMIIISTFIILLL